MKQFLSLLAVILIAWYSAQLTPADEKPVISTSSYVAEASPAFGVQDDGTQVAGRGAVVRILPDDTEGSQHQRFIVRLASGQTLLISHNIDLAPRVAGLREGDTVSFNGEYVWNEQGGLVHWTHDNPNRQGHHPDGWLEHEGRRYQ
ncbi:MAG: DUF3465 domain-containing protein [Gammaproteobacteria bacterium]|nr:DUF3465 domain-containing protein [Gammaproteobacteria bacterium]